MKYSLYSLALLAWLPAQLSAASIISTLPGAGSCCTLSGGGPRAFGAGFTLPGGQSYTLDSVSLALSVSDNTATFRLELYGSDGLGEPTGTALVTFTVPDPMPTGTGVFVFTPDSPFVMAASSRYWLVAGRTVTDSGNGIVWLTGGAATGLATYDGLRYSSVGQFPPTDLVSPVPAFEVNGTSTGAAVPEPSSFALVGLGCAVLVGWRRSRPA